MAGKREFVLPGMAGNLEFVLPGMAGNRVSVLDFLSFPPASLVANMAFKLPLPAVSVTGSGGGTGDTAPGAPVSGA